MAYYVFSVRLMEWYILEPTMYTLPGAIQKLFDDVIFFKDSYYLNRENKCQSSMF